MHDSPKYFDTRARFWQRHFDAAQSYEAYLSSVPPEKAKRWRDMDLQIPALSAEQKLRLAGHGRIMRVLVSSSVACGDCVRQGPMLRRAAEAGGSQIELRLIDREAFPELTDELRILGAKKVPVAVFLSEDWFEAGRFGDRMLAVYRAKAAREYGPACESGLVAPPLDQLAADQEEWVGIFERMLLMLRLSPMLRERHGD
jgi:hypothetical protein